MIIVNKKRIIQISISIIAIIGILQIGKANMPKNTVETVALPVSNKVIVLDAGHGKPDERCTKLTGNN